MLDEWILPNSRQVITAALAIVLHQRSAWRLHLVMIGILFAKDRKTITSCFRAAGIVRQYKAFYHFIGAMRRETQAIATVLSEIMRSLRTLKEKLIGIGAKVVSHACYVAFQMAEVMVSKVLFREILDRIRQLRFLTIPARPG